MSKEEREGYDEREEEILIDAGLNEEERTLISNFIWDVNKGKYRDLSSASLNYDGSVCVESWIDGGFHDIPTNEVLEFLRSNGVKESHQSRGRMLKEEESRMDKLNEFSRLAEEKHLNVRYTPGDDYSGYWQIYDFINGEYVLFGEIEEAYLLDMSFSEIDEYLSGIADEVDKERNS